jgi:Tfp pilus assembly protein PilF
MAPARVKRPPERQPLDFCKRQYQPCTETGERSGNTEAYLTFLRGRALIGRMAVMDTEAALPNFEKAIALDPQFAAAYASLYDAHMQLADLRHEDPAPVRLRYRALVERALAIDPQSGAAYFARAMWAGAPNAARELDFRRGAALDRRPGGADGDRHPPGLRLDQRRAVDRGP